MPQMEGWAIMADAVNYEEMDDALLVKTALSFGINIFLKSREDLIEALKAGQVPEDEDDSRDDG